MVRAFKKIAMESFGSTRIMMCNEAENAEKQME